MKIKELFRGDIERPIETVIHVDLSDEQIVAHEIDEYVVTDNIRDHLEELAELYAADIDWGAALAVQAGAGNDAAWVVDAAFGRYAREAVNFAGGRPRRDSERF